MTPANVYEHGGRRRCRECQRERSRRWQKANRRRVYHENPQKARARSRLKAWAHNHGVTPTEARAILAAKPSECEVCGAENERIVYDHDHNTGAARGWLCDRCNHALGHARDNPALLRALADYLERSAS